MKKLFSIIFVLFIALSINSFVFAEESLSGNTGTKATVPQEIKDKRDQLRVLFDEAKAIKSQLEATKGQLKTRMSELRTGFKSMSEEDKAAAKEKFLELKVKISAYKAEIKTLRVQLHLKTEAMKLNWIKLREAMKALNFDAAGLTLDDMLQIKPSKNADLAKVLEIRTNILEELR